MGELIGWAISSIVVPVFAPLAFVWFLQIQFPEHVGTDLVRRSVKDGQLLWLTIALAASAMYDVIERVDNPGTARWVVWTIFFWFVLLTIVAVMLVSAWTLAAASFASTKAPPGSAATTAGRRPAHPGLGLVVGADRRHLPRRQGAAVSQPSLLY